MTKLALKIINSVTCIERRRINLSLFLLMMASTVLSSSSFADNSTVIAANNIAKTSSQITPQMTHPINSQKTIRHNSYQGTDWLLKNTEDIEIRLSDYQGKPVILVFWATWCPYCKKLLPGIAKLHEKYQAKGLTVFAVNIKEDWQPKTYWRNHDYKFDALLNGDEVAELYNVRGTPAVVFIAPDGKVLKTAYFSDPNHASLEQFAQFYLK